MRKIAAHRCGLSDPNVADFPEGFGHDRHRLPHHRRTFHRAVSGERADANPIALLGNPIEPGYRLEVDKTRIVNGPLFHENHECRSARDGTGVVAMLDQKIAGLGQRLRLQKIE